MLPLLLTLLALATPTLAAPALAAPAAPALPTPHTTIEIRASVPLIDGAPAVDPAWILTRVQRADALFAPYGLRFRLAPIEARPTTPDALTRADRDALAPLTRPHVVNLFIVRRLNDIHQPDHPRRGVHWHVKASRKHYIIMASYASEGILAHELAHFFGNPTHRHRPGNLVGYLPGLWPTLDPDQHQRLKRALHRMVRSGELRPVGEGTR